MKKLILFLTLIIASVCHAANDFSGDPNCVALWSLDDGGGLSTADSIGTNTLTNSGMTADTGTFKEGDASGLSNSTSDQMYVLDGDLDAGFPLKNGDGNKKISICYWVRCTGFPSSGSRYIIAKYASGTRSFAVYTTSGGSPDDEPYLVIGYNNGDSGEAVGFGTSMVANIWYHFGVTYQDSDKSYNIRIWDDNAGALLGGAEVSGNTTNNINVENADWTIGSDDSVNSTLGMQIDEVVVFNDILSSAEIDQIRAGTFGAAAGASSAQVIIISKWFDWREPLKKSA